MSKLHFSLDEILKFNEIIPKAETEILKSFINSLNRSSIIDLLQTYNNYQLSKQRKLQKNSFYSNSQSLLKKTKTFRVKIKSTPILQKIKSNIYQLYNKQPKKFQYPFELCFFKSKIQIDPKKRF